MPDKDGYPTRSDISIIRQWRIGKMKQEISHANVLRLIAELKRMWWAPDWGFNTHDAMDSTLHKHPVIRLELHTGGWSGNEEIIQELKQTFFWMFYWHMSIRGGHYWFEIPKPIK